MGCPKLHLAQYTLEDWKHWEGRWELIRGVAYDITPAPSTEHQSISMGITGAIWTALDEAKRKHGGGCQLFAAPTDVYLEAGVVQPDLLVVCDPTKISPRGIEGAPYLIVEILSPSTARKDNTDKRALYERCGVAEYLIVSPGEPEATLLKLQDGRYVIAATIPRGTVASLLSDRIQITLL